MLFDTAYEIRFGPGITKEIGIFADALRYW